MKDLAGKVAFITGGASGIGFGTAQECIAAGMRVVIADIRPEQLEAARSALGSQAHAILLDARAAGGVDNMVDIHIHKGPRVEIGPAEFISIIFRCGFEGDYNFVTGMQTHSGDAYLVFNGPLFFTHAFCSVVFQWNIPF